MPSVTESRSARERLLDAADRLFYSEGVHTVGIDRVIETAGVAKASLYNTFGSKDELVRAYLRRRHEALIGRLQAAVDRHRDPRRRLLAIFDAQADWMARPTYNGCAFAHAAAESPVDGVERTAVRDYRDDVRALITRLARDAGARRPDALAAQLHLIYDGAATAGRYDPKAATASARAAATAVLDASL